jgi:hypothetical protein
MKAGAVEFLTKPFRDQDLLDSIQRVIKNQQPPTPRKPREVGHSQVQPQSLRYRPDKGPTLQKRRAGHPEIRSQRPGHPPNFYDALLETLTRMRAVTGRKGILTITSGVDTFSKSNFQ